MKKRLNQGYTLIELAFGLVVLGVLVVALWRFGFTATQRIEQMEAPQTLVAADQALIGFIAANNRLPCPDTDNDGLENCGGAAIGRLPVVTLGLARADVLNVRYGVFRSATNNADLVVASDRFYPWLTRIPSVAGVAPVAFTEPLGAINGIDFCHALRLAGALPVGLASISTALNIRAPDTALIKNVAYALSLPGVGSDPAVNMNAVANSFASPTQPVSMAYRDTVLAVDFGQLFDRMSCGAVLAATGHAHPNAASAAAIMYGAMLDYKVQLDLQAEIAEVGVLSAGAGVASAAAGVLSGASEVLTGSSLTLSTIGAMAPSIPLAAAGIALSIAGTVSAAIALDSAITSRDNANALVAQFPPTVSASSALATTVRANAVAADAAGLY